MAEYSTKKFYWIKLTDHFLTSETVDFLLSQKDGANYVVLYQMICLKCVNTDGELARKIGEIIIPFDIDKIARDSRHFSVDTVRVALELYKSLGLIYEQENGILKIANFERLIGSQTEGAMKKEIQKSNREITPKLEGGTKVENIPPEIKILDTKILDNRDKDIKDKELKDIIVGKPDCAYQKIIDYLNNRLNTKYKLSTAKTKEMIKARYNEGFTEQDFYTVIDKKCDMWKETEMEKYLRPITLFGTKFESYLNEKVTTQKYNGDNIFYEIGKEGGIF